MEEQYRLYETLPKAASLRSWAEIDLEALRFNYRMLCRIVWEQDPDVRPICVVKADAYGHGAPACVRVLLEEGCSFFAVACLEEARVVREVCCECGVSADVLIFGYTDPALARELAELDLLQALLSPDYAAALALAASEAHVRVRTHIAIDSGMNRIGFCVHTEEALLASADAVVALVASPFLSVEGAFTHFARADEPLESEGSERADLQSARYRAFCKALEARGLYLPFLHICNSAASVRRSEDRFNGVRLGILLYGARPSEHVVLPVRSVMRLCCKVVHVHKLLPHEGVSYGGHFSASEERMIATLPIGYADGFSRAYSGCFVTVETENGKRQAPVVGHVCMDQCMLDVTGLGVNVGDRVILFGDSPKQLAELSEHAQTIDYEVLCRISPRVPRVYL